MAFDSAIYAGLSGVRLPIETYEIGEGLRFSRTYVHLFAPYMMAFAPAAPGRPHPGPWRTAKGGIAFDIALQLYVPSSFDTSEGFDRLNTVWWLVALLRFRVTQSAVCPVISDTPFADAVDCEHEPVFLPVEVDPRRLSLRAEPSVLSNEDLSWIADNWSSAGMLMGRSKVFNALFRAFDQCLFLESPALAMLLLWGALENVFSPSRAELRFRISTNIASYLEPIGHQRMVMQKRIVKLYDARSTAAHTGALEDASALEETFEIAKRVLNLMIANGSVPTRNDLDAQLFGIETD